MTTRERLDRALVSRGLAPSRSRAAALVGDGHVRVGGVPALRVSQGVGPTELIEVAPGTDDVSRGAQKLRGALRSLAEAGAVPRVDGRRCLDAGASTGGFTQVLLERGAATVLAVDVGHGQLSPRIAEDPRVTSVEGLNIRDLQPSHVPEPVDLVVGDMSFISLGLVVEPLLRVLAPRGDLLLLVKPQFEVGRDGLGPGGVVVDPRARARAVRDAVAVALHAGAAVLAVTPSGLAGAAGNKETFVWLRASEAGAGRASALPPTSARLLDDVERAVVEDATVLLAQEDRL